MRKTLVSLVIALTAIVGLSEQNSQATSHTEISGEIGSGLALDGPNLPDGLVPTSSPCEATLDEVKARMPVDHGTQWVFASPRQYHTETPWGGLFNPSHNLIIISDELPCEYLGIVATHEWVHQHQKVSGLKDQSDLNGSPRYEIVAECTARVIAGHYEWPSYQSYPETSGTPCTEVSGEVKTLLASM